LVHLRGRAPKVSFRFDPPLSEQQTGEGPIESSTYGSLRRSDGQYLTLEILSFLCVPSVVPHACVQIHTYPASCKGARQSPTFFFAPEAVLFGKGPGRECDNRQLPRFSGPEHAISPPRPRKVGPQRLGRGRDPVFICLVAKDRSSLHGVREYFQVVTAGPNPLSRCGRSKELTLF